MFEKNIRLFQLLFLMMKVNFFWFVFTFAGGVVFGIFPATISSFELIRKIFLDKDHEITFKNFKNSYFKNLKIGNKIFFAFVTISSFLLWGRSFLNVNDHSISALFFSISIKTLFFVLILELISFFPSFSHFSLTKIKIFLQPFLLIFCCPIEIVFSCMILLFTFYLYQLFPVLCITLGISLPAYGILSIQLKKYDKLIVKYNKQGE